MYSIFGLKDKGKVKERCCYYDEENLQVIDRCDTDMIKFHINKPVCTKCSWTLLKPTDFVQPDSPPLLSDRVGGWESRSVLNPTYLPPFSF